MISRPRRLLVSLSFFVAAQQTAFSGTSGAFTNTNGGLWSTSSNWQNGLVASGADADADFATLFSPATVALDSPRTMGHLVFGPAGSTIPWTLTNDFNSANVLTLATSSGSPSISGVANISASIAGTQGFTVGIVSILSLSGANTFTGTVNVAGGSTSVAGRLSASWSSGGTFGSIPANSTVLLNQFASLTLDRENNDADFLGAITGAGSTTITGNGGFLNLGAPGDNVQRLSPDGDLTLNIGLNLFKNPQTIGALNGNGTITSNTGGAAANVTLTVGNNGDNGTFSGVIDNNGSEAIQLTKIGAGTQILTGANTYTAGTIINAGTLQLGNGSSTNGSIAGNVTINANGTLAFANPNGQTFNGLLTGNGTLLKTGAGTLALAGNSVNFAGPVTVNIGNLTISGGLTAHALVVNTPGTTTISGHASVNAITVNNGTLVTTGTFDLNPSAGSLPTGTSAATFTLNGGNATISDFTFDGGSFSFLSGSLSTLDPVEFTPAAIVLHGKATSGPITSSSTLVNQNLSTNNSATIDAGANVFISGGLSSSTLTNAGTAFITAAANLTLTGNLTNNGTLVLEPAAAPSISGSIINNHILTVGTSFTGSGSVTNNDTLTVDGTFDVAKSGGLINALGATVVVPTGSTLHFTSVHFTNNGLLSLDNGSVAGTANAFINNDTSALIRGTGSIGISVTSGGTITAADGTLTFTSTVNNGGLMTAAADAAFNLATGNLTNNGTFANAGALFASTIHNTGNFTQSGPQTWSGAATFTNTAGNATFQSNAKLTALNITAGTVDITTSKFVIESAQGAKSTTLATLHSSLASHSLIASGLPANEALALLDNAALNFTTFGGLPVDANSLLLSAELFGDANADGKVDLTDLSTILNNFGTTSSNWTDGNFDNAATIDLTDLSDLLNNFGLTNPSPSSQSSALGGSSPQPSVPTPEPASLMFLSIGGAIALRRRHNS